MSAKKDTNLIDSVRNATTGYTAVVLGVICFILVLLSLTALTRFIVGIGFSSGTTTAATTPSTSSAPASLVSIATDEPTDAEAS